MCWTPVRQSSFVKKAPPIHFRSRPCRRSSLNRMTGLASGAELAERALGAMFREGPPLYCNGYGDISGLSVQTLRANGAVQLPCSTSTPCFLGCGSRLLPRRFSQQLNGPQTSPSALPRDLDVMGEQAARGPLTYVMLPLDTVNAEGIFRYAGSNWFSQALQLLVASGVHGVAMDFWWGAVEKSPGQYNWAGYKQVLEVIKQTGLKVQAVMSFHACGGNVGDTVQIPLPDWVLQCGESDPDIFFADRPRNGSLGNRNREYISIWADDAPGVLRGRSPMQCYEDFMTSLRDTFHQELGAVIDEVIVGAGPCGELRLPSYVEANGWRFPGAGEFQCYDRRALASLAQAAREAGHPEWGYTGPHDTGQYNSLPENTGFFNSHCGSWNTPYGRFFLEWYSNCLLRHGERLLTVANQVLASKLSGCFAQGMLQTYSQSTGGGLGFGLSLPQGTSMSSQQSLSHLQRTPSGRTSTMALNRILETGTYLGGGISGGFRPQSSMPPPSLALPLTQQPQQLRQGSEGAAVNSSISPSYASSSISTYTTTSCGSGTVSQAGSLAAGPSSCGQLGNVLTTQPSLGSGNSGGSGGDATSPQAVPVNGISCRKRAGSGDGNEDGRSGASSDPGGGSGGQSGGSSIGGEGGGCMDIVVDAVLARRASIIAACGTAELAQAAGLKSSEGGSGRGGGSVRTASSGCSVPGGLGGGLDAAMIDVEPSDASHTSTLATEMLAAPPGSSSGSGPLCHTHVAMAVAGGASSGSGSGGPSPLADGRFRSSTSLLADSETMYGQGTAFTAVAASSVGAMLTCGGTARMDLCNSMSSLSTEYHSGGGGRGSLQTPNMIYMDVATSLVADVDDESDADTSCGTAVEEEADDLFGITSGGGTDRGDGLRERGDATTLPDSAAALASAGGGFGNEGPHSRSPMTIGLALGIGLGVADGVPPQHLPPAAMPLTAAMQLPSPTSTSNLHGGGGLHLALKIAGIHWWYRSRSHAAELTAGYYNVEGRDGYAPIVELCARHRANLVLTCVEMCDAQHPAQAQCGPEGLLRQLRQLAARAGVLLSGENALPIFSTGGVDNSALGRIVKHVRPWPVNSSSSRGGGGGSAANTGPTPFQATSCHPTGSAPGGASPSSHHHHHHRNHYHHHHFQHGPASAFSQPTAAAVAAAAMAGSSGATYGVSYRMSESGRPIAVASMPMLPQDAHPSPQTALALGNLGGFGGFGSSPSLDSQWSFNGNMACPSPGSLEVLPGLRAFTFLRLVPEMLLPGYQRTWLDFMGRLLSGS